MTWSGFKKSDDSQLLPIRQMELTKELSKVQADEKLSADQKKAKVEDIRARIAEIEKQIAAKS